MVARIGYSEIKDIMSALYYKRLPASYRIACFCNPAQLATDPFLGIFA
jgi:hypothetical protein